MGTEQLVLKFLKSWKDKNVLREAVSRLGGGGEVGGGCLLVAFTFF